LATRIPQKQSTGCIKMEFSSFRNTELPTRISPTHSTGCVKMKFSGFRHKELPTRFSPKAQHWLYKIEIFRF
jgi:hypothetical protein